MIVDFVRTHRVISAMIAALAILVLVAVVVISTKRISPLAWGWHGQVNVSSGLALGGYDPVAYHIAGAATRGNEAYSAEWKGARWLFSSEGNRALFEATPEKYAPQFGGFCSFATSKGFTATADPLAWRIEGGKLYLFNDASMRDSWVEALGAGIVQRSELEWAARPRPIQ